MVKKIFCITAVVFLTAAVYAKPSAKFNKKLTIKTANEAAEYVLSKPVNAKYPTVCSYYSVLKLAQTLNDQKLIDAVKANYAAYPATTEEIVSSEDKSTGAEKRK